MYQQPMNGQHAPQPQASGPPPPAPQQQQAPPPQQYYQAAPPQYYQQGPPPAMWGHPQQHMPPQYAAPPPQQYAPPPPHQYAQPPPQQYAQQPPPHYGGAPAPAPGAEDVKTLWIGDLQYWMDENYLYSAFAPVGPQQVTNVKIIRSKSTGQPEGYGFVEFLSRAAAEYALSFNGQMMPSVEQAFKLNWASSSSGDKRGDDGSDHTIFVGDLAADVTDAMLEEIFKASYPSVKGANVVTDRATGRSKGYGFVRFGDATEQARAMTEMNGVQLSTRHMRIGPAANKKNMGTQQTYSSNAGYQSSQGNEASNDPNNTTIFVGGLDSNIDENYLKQVFTPYGEVNHVKIPVGKRCGFVQFTSRSCAEGAINALNGTLIGSSNVRLSWGRSTKQPQQDASQGNVNSYYGYQQGHDAYYGASNVQDPSMQTYGYAGYGSYEQQQPSQPQQQPPQQQPPQ
ncbi:polyadenylate-binding protein RBP45 isoform X1 [Lolium perenne]|uniref:polyadenylate-binding protein RBP45 isoform X1 n=1 Tax=Lolium perenne TaxID=4522 RepID=UPI0021EB1BE5|nr:RNA-binding protein L-like isoform X1 [Lolium perenne]